MTPESFVSWGLWQASSLHGLLPQAGRGPALPVFSDSSLPPLPRSSVPAWQTTVRWPSLASVLQNTVVETYANDALGANDLDELVGHRALGVALGIRLDVAEVTNMAVLVGRGAVGLAVGVDCRKAQHHVHGLKALSESRTTGPHTVRAGRGAAVGVVTKGVDVHATLGVGIVAADVPGNGGRGRLGLLLEGDGARDLGVTPDDSN